MVFTFLKSDLWRLWLTMWYWHQQSLHHVCTLKTVVPKHLKGSSFENKKNKNYSMWTLSFTWYISVSLKIQNTMSMQCHTWKYYHKVLTWTTAAKKLTKHVGSNNSANKHVYQTTHQNATYLDTTCLSSSCHVSL